MRSPSVAGVDEAQVFLSWMWAAEPGAAFFQRISPESTLRQKSQRSAPSSEADWMKSLLPVLPDMRYEVKSFATDSERNNVAAYGVFYATHTGEGGPVPPTGKSVSTDYVYVMQFEGDKIAHMTKIWNAGLALKQIGWA